MASQAEKIKVYVSTVPGLEFLCVSECEEVFQTRAKKEGRGRVSFESDVQQLDKLCNLRSVHHYWVEVFKTSSAWGDACCKEDILKSLEIFTDSLDWEKSLRAFNHYKNKTHRPSEWKRIEPKRSIGEDSPSQSEVKFRVTCSRNGKHCFTSMEAAKYIGSGVKSYFNWQVDLEDFDIEILAFINEMDVTIAIKISSESKHNRNVSFFGPTTLRATTSYCLLKLAGTKRG